MAIKKSTLKRHFGFRSTADVLSNLSGGVDSVYGTLLLLRAGHRVLVHHCVIDEMGRAPHERAAALGALGWYRQNGFDNFEYVESMAKMPPSPFRTRVRCVEMVMFYAGGILRAQTHIKTMAYFNNAEDSYTRDPNSVEARARLATLYNTARRDDFEVVRPVMHMTKAEIVADMPPDLFRLCSWCRAPAPDGTPCGSCNTCRIVLAAARVGGDGE